MRHLSRLPCARHLFADGLPDVDPFVADLLAPLGGLVIPSLVEERILWVDFPRRIVAKEAVEPAGVNVRITGMEGYAYVVTDGIYPPASQQPRENLCTLLAV